MRIEDKYQASENERKHISSLYADFYNFRNQRSGAMKQFQYKDFETYLKESRELFWNSAITQSEDLQELGLDFSLPFVRKEVLDFTGRLVSLNIKPRITGDKLNSYGVKVLRGLYDKWRFKNNDKVEKFWDVLYGSVNGTVCKYVGYENSKITRRYLKKYDPESGAYEVSEKQKTYWDDVWSEITPIENIYLSNISQRNIQKQGKVIRRVQMDEHDFKLKFKKYENAEYVLPGNQITSDSLYYELLAGSGITTTDKYDVMYEYDIFKDEYKISSNGVWLNPLGRGDKQVCSPLPFDHKMQPFVWSLNEAIDEKFAYGLSLPFKIKDPHKIMNTAYTLMVERELRAVEPPILTHDIEAPELIFGQNKVIPVQDINAYKELNISEPSNQFFTMLNSLQETMTSNAQGGSNNIVPSRQPKSAREVIAMEQLRQQSLGNALLMYYDMNRQEILLMLRTALQFYKAKKYSKENLKNVMSVPNQALTLGGVGNLEIRLTDKETTDPQKLFFEAIEKSIQNGKITEIIEVPIQLLDELEFEIGQIDLEPEKTDELEQAAYVEKVLTPMLNIYVPMGLADPGKVYLRHLEKMGEHPSDYSSDQMLPMLMATWGGQTPVNPMQMQGRQGQGQTIGNMNQSVTGTQYGAQSNGGLGNQLQNA